MSNSAPDTQRDLISGLPHLPVRMPRSQRELLHLLALHDPAADIMATLARVETHNVTPIDVYRLVHGRAPDGVAEALGTDDYDARRHMRAALLSAEFQASSVKTLLSALADKPREVFIHVPKCAGTDLILNIAPRRLAVPHLLGLTDWISPPDLLGAISHLARAAPLHDEIFIYGHIEFGHYADTYGVRPGDRFFTIIRDPFDLLLSQANYAVSRLCQDPLGHDPDTRETLAFLSLPRLPDVAPGTLKELAVRCLLDPRISQPNRICFFLGRKQPTPYTEVVSNLVAYDFEITTAGRYTRWLKDRWGITTATRHNSSTTFLTRREARRLFADRLAPSIAEDQKLYDVVTWALEQGDRSSVTGTEIARMAGAALLADLPTRLTAERRPTTEPLLAAHGQEAVDCFLEGLPDALVSRDRRLIEVLDIRFGAGGNSREYVREGWWDAEEDFTWTAATQSRLWIKRPPQPGDHVLHLIATPLVAGDRLRSQRIAISVNGIQCGQALASEMAVFDCDLDWALLGRYENVQIEIQMPDATQASVLTGNSDTRVLGYAVRRLLLFRIGDGPPTPTLSEPATALPDLAILFESLGENCEFGLVQRRCGGEPLGLLRFSTAPLPILLRALRARFAGMGRPEFIEIEVSDSGREYMVFDKRFHFRYHAWVDVGEQEPDDIHARETRRLPFLIRKLIDDLTDGQKIFVYRGMAPLTEADARELHAAIRAYGPGTLLWVELADADHPPGTVIEVAPGLLKGHIDRFAPGENAHDLSLDCWIAICRAAERMAKPALVHAR